MQHIAASTIGTPALSSVLRPGRHSLQFNFTHYDIKIGRYMSVHRAACK